MNHLDALEAESVYILREAFAKLDKLAILWSLGKDSNVVLWLVRKAFFGHVPFPVMHVDTERKFPEMYAFRDRYADGVEAQLHPRAVPAGRGDRPDPAAGRPLGRAQDPGPEGRGRQARLQRPDPGHPPRRGGDPRQGALFQPARRGQQLEPQGPAAGVLEPVHDQLPGRHACPRPSAAALDRGRHLEVHQAREHPGDRPLFRQERQALPLAGRPGHHQPDRRARPPRSTRSSPSSRRPGCPSAPAGPWTTSPRTRSSGCAPPATCEAGPDHARRPRTRTASCAIVIVGHVDHGKSTLVGRLIHETGSLPDGKLDAIKAMSERRGMPFEWAFLMDAIQAERDQGITIDTTQIWFHTPKRPYVIIDAPGHKEFLKNMVTGAASSEAALLLIDAHEGVQEQSRRHGYLLHLLGVKQVAVLVNKMDLVGYSADRFGQVAEDYRAYLRGLGVTPTCIIPISAREGDNMVEHCRLDALVPGPDRAAGAGRLRVQGAADRAAAARAGAGRLQVRPAADHRRPGRERHGPGRRRGGVLALEQDREDQDRSRPGTCPRRRSWRRPGRAIGVTLDRADLRRARRGDEPPRARADREQRVQGAAVLARPQAAADRQELHAQARHARGAGHGRGDRARDRHLRPVDQGRRQDRAQRRRRGRAAHQAHAGARRARPQPDHRPVRAGRGLPAAWAAASSRWRAIPTSAS